MYTQNRAAADPNSTQSFMALFIYRITACGLHTETKNCWLFK